MLQLLPPEIVVIIGNYSSDDVCSLRLVCQNTFYCFEKPNRIDCIKYFAKTGNVFKLHPEIAITSYLLETIIEYGTLEMLIQAEKCLYFDKSMWNTGLFTHLVYYNKLDMLKYVRGNGYSDYIIPIFTRNNTLENCSVDMLKYICENKLIVLDILGGLGYNNIEIIEYFLEHLIDLIDETDLQFRPTLDYDLDHKYEALFVLFSEILETKNLVEIERVKRYFPLDEFAATSEILYSMQNPIPFHNVKWIIDNIYAERGIDVLADIYTYIYIHNTETIHYLLNLFIKCDWDGTESKFSFLRRIINSEHNNKIRNCELSCKHNTDPNCDLSTELSDTTRSRIIAGLCRSITSIHDLIYDITFEEYLWFDSINISFRNYVLDERIFQREDILAHIMKTNTSEIKFILDNPTIDNIKTLAKYSNCEYNTKFTIQLVNSDPSVVDLVLQKKLILGPISITRPETISILRKYEIAIPTKYIHKQTIDIIDAIFGDTDYYPRNPLPLLRSSHDSNLVELLIRFAINSERIDLLLKLLEIEPSNKLFVKKYAKYNLAIIGKIWK